MVQLTAFIQSLKHLSAAVLCVSFSFKADNMYLTAIPYYAKLLKPLFDAHKVFVALTHVNTNTYETEQENQTWDNLLQAKLAGVNDILKRNNCPTIDIGLPFNTVYPPSLMNRLFKGQTVNNELLMVSLESRRMLLNFVNSSRVPMTNMKFLLPPDVNNKRLAAKNIWERKIEQTNNSVEIENSSRGHALKAKDEIIKQINEKFGKLNSLVESRKNLSGYLRTNPVFISGNEFINFTGAEAELTVRSPVPPFSISVQSHNVIYNRKDEPDDGEEKNNTVVFCVRRKTFSFYS